MSRKLARGKGKCCPNAKNSISSCIVLSSLRSTSTGLCLKNFEKRAHPIIKLLAFYHLRSYSYRCELFIPSFFCVIFSGLIFSTYSYRGVMCIVHYMDRIFALPARAPLLTLRPQPGTTHDPAPGKACSSQASHSARVSVTHARGNAPTRRTKEISKAHVQVKLDEVHQGGVYIVCQGGVQQTSHLPTSNEIQN